MEQRPIGRDKSTDSSAKGDAARRGQGLGLGGQVGSGGGPNIKGNGAKEK